MYEDLLTSTYGERDLTLVKGQGSRVWDDRGNSYLDFVSGIAVNAFGHNYPPVVKAITEQLQKVSHTSNLFLLEPQIQLAKKLVDLSVMAGGEKVAVFFSNSGAEANEGAIKFVRQFYNRSGQPHRVGVVSIENSFHGRTFGALAATGQDALKAGFGPMPSGFQSVSLTNPSSWSQVVLRDVAAIIMEPILAEGGIQLPSPEFVKWVAEAQSQGVQLICDEIQTGLGRTGTLFGYEHLGLKPDMVTLAKPLGGGLPLGAILMKEEIASSIKKGDHGSTFGGNPVACAAGLAVLESILERGFLDKMKENSSLFRTLLEDGIKKLDPSMFSLPLLGKGFLVGLKFKGDLLSLIGACRQKGLLILRAGKDVVRFLPPLNVSETEIREGLAIFLSCAEEHSNKGFLEMERNN